MRASWTVCSTPSSRGCSQQELMEPSVFSRTRHGTPCCAACFYQMNWMSYAVCMTTKKGANLAYRDLQQHWWNQPLALY